MAQKWAQNGIWGHCFLCFGAIFGLTGRGRLRNPCRPLSKWVIFKANIQDFAGEEGQNKGKQRDKERQDEKMNSHRKPKTQEKIFEF